MDQDDWVEYTFTESTLIGGIAELADVDPSDVKRYEDEARGRSRFEEAVKDVLSDTIGPDSVDYTELEDQASGSHLRAGRVHLKVRASAFDVIKNLVTLGVLIALHNPTAVAPALGLADTLRKALTVLSPAERDALADVADRQRRGIAVSRDDLSCFGIDVERLIRQGVLDDRGDLGLRVSF